MRDIPKLVLRVALLAVIAFAFYQMGYGAGEDKKCFSIPKKADKAFYMRKT